jgi:hypothetical protein
VNAMSRRAALAVSPLESRRPWRNQCIMVLGRASVVAGERS